MHEKSKNPIVAEIWSLLRETAQQSKKADEKLRKTLDELSIVQKETAEQSNFKQ